MNLAIDIVFRSLGAVMIAYAGSTIARLVLDSRRWSRHIELARRHDDMLRSWMERQRNGMLPTPRMINQEAWLFDLLDCDDATVRDLDRAEAVLDDLDREPWMFIN